MEPRRECKHHSSRQPSTSASPFPPPPPLASSPEPRSPGAQARGGVRRDPAHPQSLPTWQHSQWEPWWQPGKKNTRPPSDPLPAGSGASPGGAGRTGCQSVLLCSPIIQQITRTSWLCLQNTPLGFKAFVTGSSEARLAGTPKSHQGSERREESTWPGKMSVVSGRDRFFQAVARTGPRHGDVREPGAFGEVGGPREEDGVVAKAVGIRTRSLGSCLSSAICCVSRASCTALLCFSVPM